MTALDTTNLRLTFTAPASGNVHWRVRVAHRATTTMGAVLLGVLESTTVIAREAPVAGVPQALATTSCVVYDACGTVTGVSGGSHSWDAAYAVQTVAGSGGVLNWGGPNNTTTNNAFGGASFTIWTA